MSTSFTAPIDLITTDRFAKCTRKCEYVIGYKKTSFEVTLESGYLLFRPLFGATSMIYNGATYAIFDMKLYLNSLHAWNSETTDCELQITHKTLNGQNTLITCIPVSRDGTGQTVTDLIDPLINVQQSFDYEPASLIPKARYYNYTGSGQFNKLFNGITYVLFDKADALFISEAKYNKLKDDLELTEVGFANNIDPRMISTDGDANSVLYSSGPPSSGQQVVDDIYIECKPTGEEGEEEVDKTPNTGSSYDYYVSTTVQNEITQWLMKVIVGIFVFICLLRVFDAFSKKILITKPSAP